MTAHAARTDGAPRWVTVFTPVAKLMLRAGIPLGPNGLITVRGRTSGEPRTTPVAVIQSKGRRWIWAPWGDVHWVRNLRAAGEGILTLRGREIPVRATELDPAQRVGYFRNVLGPLARSVPFGTWFIRTVDGVDLNDPEDAADGRFVFELHPAH